ncbi:COG5473 Predicted integral membrane protein [Rhabdaerophilaceae bacterium]
MNESSSRKDPVVRPITRADIADSFAAGLRDFQAQPLYGMVFGGFYAAGGIAILLTITAFQMTYLAYPLASGFALLGPFVALWLYEVSRRRESGENISFGAIWKAVRARKEVAWMAFVTLFIFIIWMYQVRLLMALVFGLNANFSTLQQFFTVILTTREGLFFLVVGNTVGATLSLILFSLTVVSYPLLLDRDVDFVTAMITSVRAVLTSPAAMLGWAFVVVISMMISTLPLFLGLLFTLPVLGHTTWHLYRRLVVHK